jgi:hypothetical protein
MVRFPALAAIAAALTGFAAAGDDVSRYLHPNATFLLGVEMQKIAASPLAASLRTHASKAAVAGFDPLSDVTRILVSSPGQSPGAKPKDSERISRLQPGETPLLMLITGHFDLDRLKKLASAEGEVIARYGQVELITPPHGRTASMHFALMSPTFLLAGDAVSIREAIDRSVLAPVPFSHPNLLRRAQILAQANDIWMTAAVSPGESMPANLPAAALFSDLRSMEMAVNLHNGLGVRMVLNTRTADAASKLSGALAMLTQMAPPEAKASGALDLLKRLAFKTERTSVSRALALDAATVERCLAGLADSTFQRGGKLAAGRGGATPPAAVAPAQPKSLREIPPEKRVIRIYGADSGPIEIPMNP